jgi:hypothetical protein
MCTSQPPQPSSLQPIYPPPLVQCSNELSKNVADNSKRTAPKKTKQKRRKKGKRRDPHAKKYPRGSYGACLQKQTFYELKQSCMAKNLPHRGSRHFMIKQLVKYEKRHSYRTRGSIEQVPLVSSALTGSMSIGDKNVTFRIMETKLELTPDHAPICLQYSICKGLCRCHACLCGGRYTRKGLKDHLRRMVNGCKKEKQEQDTATADASNKSAKELYNPAEPTGWEGDYRSSFMRPENWQKPARPSVEIVPVNKDMEGTTAIPAISTSYPWNSVPPVVGTTTGLHTNYPWNCVPPTVVQCSSTTYSWSCQPAAAHTLATVDTSLVHPYPWSSPSSSNYVPPEKTTLSSGSSAGYPCNSLPMNATVGGSNPSNISDSSGSLYVEATCDSEPVEQSAVISGPSEGDIHGSLPGEARKGVWLFGIFCPL